MRKKQIWHKLKTMAVANVPDISLAEDDSFHYLWTQGQVCGSQTTATKTLIEVRVLVAELS